MSNTRDYKTFEQQTSFLKAEVDEKNARRAQFKAGKHANVFGTNKQNNNKNQSSSKKNNGAKEWKQ